MEENQHNTALKGVKIRTFNNCIICLSSIIFLLLIFITISMTKKYSVLIDYTEDYIACEQDADSLMAASDYLTEQVRLYAQNMDTKYMEAYFEEANVTCRREKALDELKNHKIKESIMDDLEAALEGSRDLMKSEFYSMKLISTANGYDPDLLPQEIQDTLLTAEDASLSSEEMIAKARDLVFNEGYQDAKALIYSHLSHYTNEVTSITHSQQKDSAKALADSLFQQRILISILFIITVLNFLVITLMIVRPLKFHINRIKENDTLEIMGSYEFKYLALTYNDIYELNTESKKLLTQKAEQDSLTGLLNRRSFDQLKKVLENCSEPITLTVIDVDKFKLVNDKYGHETGDLLLKHVASLLKSSFRTGDYVIRFGGDEFVIILTGITEEHLYIVEKKLSQINKSLQNPTNDLPPSSLSAGIAYSEKGFPKDLFSKADQALYQAKSNGRCGCSFYQ